MPVPDPRDPRPAYEQIADDLRAAIKEGRLQPGDRLPTEREHAARYGVAVATYRQGLAVLREQGWLATQKRHGTVILRPDAASSPEFTELSQRIDQIQRQVSSLAQQISSLAESPAPDGARLSRIEAEIARLSGQIDALADRTAR